jgi:hypothetical protein
MAGYVGDARQWQKFKRRANRLFTRFSVDIFHTVDVKHSDKDFAGWKVDRKIEFLDELQHIVNETLELGFVSILRYDDYDYYKKLLWVRGTRPDSLYGILFRASLSAVIDGVTRTEKWLPAREPKLSVVIEDGHRNAEDAVRLYKYFVELGGSPKALAGLTFSTKENSLPLAAADLLAYSAYREEVGGKPIGTPKKRPKAEASYRGNAFRIFIGRDTLNSLHQQAIALRKAS